MGIWCWQNLLSITWCRQYCCKFWEGHWHIRASTAGNLDPICHQLMPLKNAENSATSSVHMSGLIYQLCDDIASDIGGLHTPYGHLLDQRKTFVETAFTNKSSKNLGACAFTRALMRMPNAVVSAIFASPM